MCYYYFEIVLLFSFLLGLYICHPVGCDKSCDGDFVNDVLG